MDAEPFYSKLAPDQEAAEMIFSMIRQEYQRTCQAVLEITGHKHLMDGEATLQRSLVLRNPYIDPLNYIQVEMIRRPRALPDAHGSLHIPGQLIVEEFRRRPYPKRTCASSYGMILG